MTLRILHVSKEFQPLSSGVARHIQGLAQAMRNNGEVELSILAPNIDASQSPCRLQQGGYRDLWKAVGANDLVHVHGARTPFSAAAALLARACGIPLVYTPHCYYDTGGALRRGLKRLWDLTIERMLVRSADAVVLLHEGWVADLAQRGLHPASVLIVPNCIDDRRQVSRLAAGRLEGSPALLSVGRLDPVKRLDDVIAALLTEPLAKAVLHIIGRGEDRPRLEALAAQQGVAERVRFHGWQDDVVSEQMMAGCDAMVLASEREGMPTVVIEALLAGVSIACSDIEGCRAITDTVGWPHSFAVGDIAALGECIANAARSQVPAAVTEAVRQGFTWQRKAPELADAYARLVSPRRRPLRLMRRLAMRMSDYRRSLSLDSRLGNLRIGPLLEMINEVYALNGYVNVIDVGGTQHYWNKVPQAFLDSRRVSITLVNIDSVRHAAGHARFTLVQGDGCNLAGYADRTFHVAHSNSVIEHVGNLDRMTKFVRELARVSERYFIQTPDFWCPLEPHCMTPLFHWLPRRLRIVLVQRIALGHWRRANNHHEAEALVDSARLLTRSELRALLPDARIISERILGLPKSLIAMSS